MKFFKFLVLALAMCISSSSLAEITLTPTNTVTLRGPVNTASVADVSYKLLSSNSKELYLFIDSPGGSITAGMELVHVLKNLPKETKVTCITNFGASMAFIITQACPTRVVMPHSVLMQHVASYGMEGNEPNNYSFAQFIRRMVKKLVKMQAQRMKMDASKFYSKTRDDWWMYGDEALEYKAADRMESNVSCSKELTQKRESVSLRTFFFSVNMTFSGCPLIRGTISNDTKQIVKSDSEKASQEYEDLMSWWQPERAIQVLQSRQKMRKVPTTRVN